VRARADGGGAAALLAGGATFVETATPGGGGVTLPVPKGVKGGVTASRCNPATSLNPDSAGIAAVGCGQLVTDEIGSEGTVAAASAAAGDDDAAAAPAAHRADSTANTLIKGVPTVASGFGRRRRLQRATQLPAVEAGGDEGDGAPDTARVSVKSVEIVEDGPAAGPIPTHKEKPVAAVVVAPRPAQVRAAAAESAEVGNGGAALPAEGTVAVSSLPAAPPADTDANTFDGDVYALAIPSLLG
jgi:hypothetical protein